MLALLLPPQDPSLSPLELLDLGAAAVRYLRAFTTQCWLPVRARRPLAATTHTMQPRGGAQQRGRAAGAHGAGAAAAAAARPTTTSPPARTPPCALWARCAQACARAAAGVQDFNAPIAMFDNSWAVALVTIWNDLTVPSNGL